MAEIKFAKLREDRTRTEEEGGRLINVFLWVFSMAVVMLLLYLTVRFAMF